MEKETKAECVRHKAQLTSMTTQLQKMKEANTSLNIQLNDKVLYFVFTIAIAYT